eukprot:CAMPEP_0182418986 /NCGR_PEP_ID=MMETSP1167-20130531/3367_1 /TAXON_ID=2988 /ORGANISM="Mallomonas Sp, Strain CCMP3275" /LENGTH=139 /DNA_ID=CAMNT_0024593513 /DNA_START=271 /DNA_END=690 /DNA_ORIENTATION=-
MSKLVSAVSFPTDDGILPVSFAPATLIDTTIPPQQVTLAQLDIMGPVHTVSDTGTPASQAHELKAGAALAAIASDKSHIMLSSRRMVEGAKEVTDNGVDTDNGDGLLLPSGNGDGVGNTVHSVTADPKLRVVTDDKQEA